VTTNSELDQVVAALTGFAALPDWLADGMRPERVSASLVRHVPELADGRLCLVSCTPQRLRAKGSEWLARYAVQVSTPGAGPGDAGPRDVVLVGNLWAPSQPFPALPRATGAETGFGEPGWACSLPDLRLELRVQEHDEALPSLPMLIEPDAAARLLEPLLRRAGHDSATITSCEPVVVRYKPGSRCTVVVHLRYAGTPGPTPVVLKTHQGDKGESAWAAMNALWERPETWRHAVRLAEPIGYLPDERILVQGPVPEDSTLKDLAREAIADGSSVGLERLREELSRTAFALATVHTSGASYGRTATFEAELAEVTEVVDRLNLSVPELAVAGAPLLRDLATRAAADPPDPVVPAHHDFRPAQVLLHSGGVGFIDFDGACMAEPALDLGRFRAKLRDIGISALGLTGESLPAERVAENLELLDGLCEHFLAEYQRHAPVSRARVVLWESCDLMTTMLHAWTKVRLLRVEPRLTVLLHQLRSSALMNR
jgi:Phosphotransferase enzyme family